MTVDLIPSGEQLVPDDSVCSQNLLDLNRIQIDSNGQRKEGFVDLTQSDRSSSDDCGTWSSLSRMVWTALGVELVGSRVKLFTLIKYTSPILVLCLLRLSLKT